MHVISKKDLNDAEMDTLTKSCSPTIAITANGEVQTHEEATVYVKELDIFLTMKVLENMWRRSSCHWTHLLGDSAQGYLLLNLREVEGQEEVLEDEEEEEEESTMNLANSTM